MHYFRLVWLRRRASLKSELMWMWKCSSMKKVLNRCIYEQLHCFKSLGVIWEFEHFWLRCFQSTWKTISITISQDSLHACDSWICFFPDITEHTTIHTNTYRVMINLTFFFVFGVVGVPGENPRRRGDNMQTPHKYQTGKIRTCKDATANSLVSDVDPLNAHQNPLLKPCRAAPVC